MSQHADSRKPSLLTDLYHHFVLFPIEKNGGGTSTTVPGSLGHMPRITLL